MQLEIINKLFLELSQIATAKTQREILLESSLRLILEAEECANNTTSMRMRLIAKDAIKRNETSRLNLKST